MPVLTGVFSALLTSSNGMGTAPEPRNKDLPLETVAPVKHVKVHFIFHCRLRHYSGIFSTWTLFSNAFVSC